MPPRCEGSGQVPVEVVQRQGFRMGECSLCGRWVLVISTGRLRNHGIESAWQPRETAK